MSAVAYPPRLLRRSEFERMVAAGLFHDEKVELIEGVIVAMSPQGTPHAGIIQMLNRLLVPALLGRADVRVQLPFAATDDSLPEPDIALVAPTIAEAHPEDAFLVIEVSETSLRADRIVKARVYARAGVPEYWIVNVADAAIEVRSRPTSDGYGTTRTYGLGEQVHIGAFPDVVLDVKTVLGPFAPR